MCVCVCVCVCVRLLARVGVLACGIIRQTRQHSCSPGIGRWDNYGKRDNRAAVKVLAGGVIMAHKATELQPGYW